MPKEVSEVQATIPVPTLAPAMTPTVDTPTLSPQPYASPSGAYEINFPQNWNCSESGPYRVDCQAPDGSAVTSVNLVNTGMMLNQPEFLNLVQAELNFTHTGQRAFNEVERNIGDGTLTVQSTWMGLENAWMGADHFTRMNAVVYHVNSSAAEDEWPKYAELFGEVNGSLQTNPEAVEEDPIYESIFVYTSPDSLFTVEVPTSWTKFLDTASIQKSQIEQFFSPDRRASVQTLVYRHGALIEQEFKATKTLEILRALYGSGFRVSHDKALPDGRERLAWFVESKQLSGISFFDSWGGSLFIFTILWDDAYQPLYQPVLDRVAESFGYP